MQFSLKIKEIISLDLDLGVDTLISPSSNAYVYEHFALVLLVSF